MKQYKSLEELPLVLSATDLKTTLGVSKATAYNLLNSNNFPTLCIGARKVVPKDAFVRWLEENTGKQVDI